MVISNGSVHSPLTSAGSDSGVWMNPATGFDTLTMMGGGFCVNAFNNKNTH